MTIGLSVLGVLIVLGTTAFVTGTKIEEKNSFCASCHTQDESKYYQRSLAPAVDLATYLFPDNPAAWRGCRLPNINRAARLAPIRCVILYVIILRR
jgi:hypothetical protein